MKLLIILIALTLTACTTQRRCFDKFPPPPPSTTTITETVTITRDTTIYIRIAADTITQTDTVRIGIDGLISYPKHRLDVKHAWSVVWIENSRLQHTLFQKEAELAETIKDAISKVETSEVEIIREPYPVPMQLSWFKQTLIRLGWAFLALIILAVAALGFRRWLPF